MAKWGSCDFGELKKLQKRLEKAEKQQKEFCEDCAKELAGRLLALAKKRTPVGHAPKLAMPEGETTVKVRVKGRDGRTRERKFLTAKAAKIQQIGLLWKGYTGGSLRSKWTIGAEVERRGDAYQIEVTNPVLYASYVEYGHRQEPGRYVPALGKRLKKAWVPGKFMLTISVKEIQRMAPGLLERKLQKFLEECFDAE